MLNNGSSSPRSTEHETEAGMQKREKGAGRDLDEEGADVDRSSTPSSPSSEGPPTGARRTSEDAEEAGEAGEGGEAGCRPRGDVEPEEELSLSLSLSLLSEDGILLLATKRGKVRTISGSTFRKIKSPGQKPHFILASK